MGLPLCFGKGLFAVAGRVDGGEVEGMKTLTAACVAMAVSAVTLLAGDKNHIHVTLPNQEPVRPLPTPQPQVPATPPPAVPLPPVAPIPNVTPATPTGASGAVPIPPATSGAEAAPIPPVRGR